MSQSVTPLAELHAFASSYQMKRDLPVRFDGSPYTRIPISRDGAIEVVVICLAEGQTSSVHDHQGSNCVVRVIKGKVLESLFSDVGDGTLRFERNHCLLAGDVSALDGAQVHQLINLDKQGTVLLNFYSPPFQL
jgi:cysteine dioxygenase